jgi:cyclopropane-fatty-acyl-phospholipid synthase
MYLLVILLRRLFPRAPLVLVGHNGSRFRIGNSCEGPVVVRLTSRWLPWRILFDPPLAMGEAYIHGELVLERGTLPELMDIIMSSQGLAHRVAETGLTNIIETLRRASRRWLQFNTRSRSRRAIALHYDLPFELFEMLLDRENAQYSCAYFTKDGEGLEEAQRRKVARVAAKMLFREGQSVLEIGCGWGGLSRALASLQDIRIRAISLSQEQVDLAKRLAQDKQIESIDYVYQDYRDETGCFDRIVSVAMFEAVGLPYFRNYFDTIARCLKDDGVAMVHTIGRLSGPGHTDTWTDKYIFPGGYSPALSEIVPHIEKSGLLLGDIEIWQDQYATTIRAWRANLVARKDEIIERVGIEVYRMFDFYLCAACTAFVHGDHAIFQIQLVKSRGVLPAGRQYIDDETDRLAEKLEKLHSKMAATKRPRLDSTAKKVLTT